MQPNSPTDAEIEAIAKNVARVLWSETYSGTASTVILAALKDVERRTAERCAEKLRLLNNNIRDQRFTDPRTERMWNEAADRIVEVQQDIRKEFHLD